MCPDEKPKLLTKTLTFGLGNPLGWDPRLKNCIPLTQKQRKATYTGLRATSRILAQVVNMLNAREYIRRVMKVPEELVDEFKPNYTPIKRELKELGIEEIDDISGATLSQTYALGMKPAFTGDHGKSLLMKGERQLPLHKINGTHPIYGRGEETKIVVEGGKHHIVVAIFSGDWAKKNDLKSGWIAFPITVKSRDKTMAEQLNRTISGEWKLKNCRIMRNLRKKGNRWLGQVVVAYFPQPFKRLDDTTVMGIDLGVNVPACLHIRKDGKPNSWAMMVGRGKDMLHTRSMIRGEIVRIIRSLRSKDSPLDGSAKDAAKDKLKILRKREKRVMKSSSQKVAARIADTAKRAGAGVWQMEELSENIKEDEPWLRRNWAPGMVVDAVRWQAEQLGAELVFVNPRYTSQRCSKCGKISSKNRPKKKAKAAEFECIECGYEDNADKNAARNISIIDIEKIIDEFVEQKMAPNGAVQ
jgi:putative transposase